MYTVICDEKKYSFANEFINPKQLIRDMEAFHKLTMLLRNSKVN